MTTEWTEDAYFWASPVNGSTPTFYHAIYRIKRENGHWVYHLQPGSLEIVSERTSDGPPRTLKK